MRNKTIKLNKKTKTKPKTKQHNKTRQHKTRHIKRKIAYGGEAVDAGSYGCVFIPALKCADTTIPYDANNISKLMYKDNAEAEMQEMKKVEQYISKIPNNDKYFLVSNTYRCNPSEITDKTDLLSFDKKCKLFTKHGIDSYNVNKNLNKLELINIPNGGLNIEKFILHILNMPNKYDILIKLNNALIKLLTNGIVPLNKLGFNHLDVKAGNILFSPDGNARLIDWGLAGSNDGVTIPSAIIDRSIAFNMPLSSIFFNHRIKKWLPDEFNRIKISPKFKYKNVGQSELLKIIAVNLINESFHETSEGHIDYITNNILHDIYKIYADRNNYNRLDYNVLTYNAIIEYIQAVLIEFVDDNGRFDDQKYFYEVFTHNVDIWGLLMAYAPLIEDGYGKLHKDIINACCRILLKYCFSTDFATKPIVVEELIEDLNSLSHIASNIPKSTINEKTKLHNKLPVPPPPNKLPMPMPMPMPNKLPQKLRTNKLPPQMIYTSTANNYKNMPSNITKFKENYGFNTRMNSTSIDV